MSAQNIRNIKMGTLKRVPIIIFYKFVIKEQQQAQHQP